MGKRGDASAAWVTPSLKCDFYMRNFLTTKAGLRRIPLRPGRRGKYSACATDLSCGDNGLLENDTKWKFGSLALFQYSQNAMGRLARPISGDVHLCNIPSRRNSALTCRFIIGAQLLRRIAECPLRLRIRLISTITGSAEGSTLGNLPRLRFATPGAVRKFPTVPPHIRGHVN